MIIDLHTHTTLGSVDSMMDVGDLIEAAKRAGLDAVCITEHGNARPDVEWLAAKYSFPVFGGIESSTELGDVLIFGIESYPRHIYRFSDLRQFVKEEDGVMVAAHPFRYDFSQASGLGRDGGLTLDDACRRVIFECMEAIEVANGWAIEPEVAFGLEVSARLGLPSTGGSDAHHPRQVGCCVTVFQEVIKNERDLVAQITNGRCHALDRRSASQKTPTYWAAHAWK